MRSLTLGEDETLSPARHLQRIRLLDLGDRPGRVDPEDLLELTSLEALDTGGAWRFRVADLPTLPALRALEVRGHGGFEDLAFLERCPALIVLDAARCDDLARLDGLSLARELTDLDVSHGAALQDLAGLRGHPSLQRLGLQGGRDRDLHPLAGLGALRALRIDAADAADLSPLAACPELSTLHVGPGEREPDLGALGALESLSLEGCPLPPRGPRSVRALTLSRVPSLPPSLGRYAGLERLYVEAPGVAPVDLRFLAGAHALVHLVLDRCQDLRDVETLGSLPSLRSAELGGAPPAVAARASALLALRGGAQA